MSDATAVTAIEEISAERAPAIYGHNALSSFVSAARKAVSGEVPDTSSRKGRERIASLAAQVSRSKTAVEKPGREYLKRIKELPKAIEAELREFVQQMDALRDEVRAPLDAWEAEQARIQRELEEREASIEAAIKRLHLACVTKPEDNSETLARYLQALEDEYRATDYGNRADEAAVVYQASLESLQAALARRQQYEAEQAELAELRRLQAEQQQREREREIAEQAAEQARQEAAQKLREAEDAAARAEQQRQQEQEESARRLQEAEQRAQQQAEQAECEAAERQARLDEDVRLRLEAEQRRKEAEAAAREADRNHRQAVLRAAKEAVMGCGIAEDQARDVIKLIAAGQVPNVKIHF